MTIFTSTLRTSLLCLCALLMASVLPAQTMASGESSAPEPSPALATDAVAGELRRGGYVVCFRHTATDFSRSGAVMQSYEGCAN